MTALTVCLSICKFSTIVCHTCFSTCKFLLPIVSAIEVTLLKTSRRLGVPSPQSFFLNLPRKSPIPDRYTIGPRKRILKSFNTYLLLISNKKCLEWTELYLMRGIFIGFELVDNMGNKLYSCKFVCG